jgi:hypothetical protein
MHIRIIIENMIEKKIAPKIIKTSISRKLRIKFNKYSKFDKLLIMTVRSVSELPLVGNLVVALDSI